MSRVPSSVLWLLSPASQEEVNRTSVAKDVGGDSHQELGSIQNHAVKAHLYREAEGAGISPSRIVFAERVSKRDHIERYGCRRRVDSLKALVFTCYL